MKRCHTKPIIRKSVMLFISILAVAAFCTVTEGNCSISQTANTIVFKQDWESGIGSWYVTNGLWQVGHATVGPPNAHSGQNVAGTVLDGYYPSYADTRLVSPMITLPSLQPGEALLLKFWQWFEFASGDNGWVQLSVNGGAWQTINDPAFSNVSRDWTQYVADISAYAGSSVRIAFYFTSDWHYEASGSYVDDIVIEKGAYYLSNPESFELGVGDWSADNGLWQVGKPTAGPSNALSGEYLAGTLFGYPSYASTRLASPRITLPNLQPGETLLLKFWQWFEFASGDNGWVQISVNGGAWQTINDPAFSNVSRGWTQYVADISAYAGSSVRFAFYFASDWHYEANGWYIDGIVIEKGLHLFTNPEGFEFGIGDWGADNGLWQAGLPLMGPGNAHSGQYLVGTLLDVGYPSYASARLISPEVKLTTAPGDIPALFFWHWFQFASGDFGLVQISVNKGPWQTISPNPFQGSSNGWTQFAIPDLSAYADSTVRFAFFFNSDWHYEASGWYIDDIRLEGVTVPTGIENKEEQPPTAVSLSQNYPNPFNPCTKIEYRLPQSDAVELIIYDIAGKPVKTLLDNRQSAGRHTVIWDGKNSNGHEVSSGVYFYRLRMGQSIETRKMTLIR